MAALPAAAGVHDLVAQSRRRAGTFRSRHLRAGGAGGARRGGRDHPSNRGERERGMLGRNHHRRRTRSPGGDRTAGQGRGADVDGVRAGPGADGHRGSLRQPRARRGGGRRVGAQGLRRRPRARGSVRLAAPQRPGLELLRQQLSARQGPARVRHPLLEPGRGAARRRPAPRFRPHRPRERPHCPGRGRGARNADRSARSPSTVTSSPA